MDRQRGSKAKPKGLQASSKRKLATTKPTKKQQFKKSTLTTAKRFNNTDPGFHPHEQFLIPSIHSEPNQPAAHGLSGHTIRVKKLYRKILRDQYNWRSLSWDGWVVAAQEVREEFEKYRNLTDVGEIETLIKEAEVYLWKTEDPSPYRPLMHPQGLLWGRNEPPGREMLKPPPSTFVEGRDYHEEERVIRHLHADPADPDYAPTLDRYAIMKIKRGEYWLDPTDPATINYPVQEYCAHAGIKFTPDLHEMDKVLTRTQNEGSEPAQQQQQQHNH